MTRRDRAPLADRLAAAFVAPPAADRQRPRASDGRARPGDRASSATTPPRGPGDPARASAIAVLCRPADALVVGGAAALVLASIARSPHALLAVWGGDSAAVRAPASARARRLATTLASRGHAAAAGGRLTVVVLAGDLGQAAPEAVRALAAAAAVPAVVALAGARDERADQLLRSLDRALVVSPAGADPTVAALACAGLVAAGARGVVVELPAVAAPARALAASGVAVGPPLRAAVRAALEAAA